MKEGSTQKEKMNPLKKILQEKNHTGLQFIKYAVCGGLAMATDILVFFLVAWLLFPALTTDDVLVRLFHLKVVDVPEYLRMINFCLSNGVAFLLSNLVAYILNVLFVFERGRHDRKKEVVLFYVVSAISVGLGVGIGALLIHGFGLSTTFSYVAKAISTVLINFVARKYIIFRH
jgi:putative flippase GtrA